MAQPRTQHKTQHEPLCKEMPAEWREFAAGMEFLRRYGPHNTANASAIGRDNLRLLHRSLLRKANYRHQINQASKKTQRYGRPGKATLIDSNQLSAQLISLPIKSSIQLIVRAGERGMFMILVGSASTSGQPASHTRFHWWPRCWPLSQPADAHSLKTDDIICITHNPSNPCILSTHSKACVVLAVFNTQTSPQRFPHSELTTDKPAGQPLIQQHNI